MIQGEIKAEWDGAKIVFHFHDGYQRCNCYFNQKVGAGTYTPPPYITPSLNYEMYQMTFIWSTGPTVLGYGIAIAYGSYVWSADASAGHFSQWTGGAVAPAFELRIKLGTGTGIGNAGYLMCSAGGGTWYGLTPDTVG